MKDGTNKHPGGAPTATFRRSQTGAINARSGPEHGRVNRKHSGTQEVTRAPFVKGL